MCRQSHQQVSQAAFGGEELTKGKQARLKPGRKKKENILKTETAAFKLTPVVIERLGYYAVRRTREEHRKVTKSEIVEEALDKYLRNKGF